jgi:hypothetical protein
MQLEESLRIAYQFSVGEITIAPAQVAISFQSSTDPSGCFDSSTWENFAPQQPGEYYADTWQSGHRALAGVEFAVVAG